MNKPLTVFGVILLVFGLILPSTPIYGMMYFAPNTKIIRIWSDPSTPRYSQSTYVYMVVENPDDANQKIWGMITDTSTGRYSKTTGIARSLTVRTLINPTTDTLIRGECGYVDNDGREVKTNEMDFTIRLDTTPVVNVRVGYIMHDYIAEAGKPVYFGYVIVNQGNADAQDLTVKVTDTQTNQILFSKNYGTLLAGKTLDVTASRESFTMPPKNLTAKIEVFHGTPPINDFTMNMLVKLKATQQQTNSTTNTQPPNYQESPIDALLKFDLGNFADLVRVVSMALGGVLALVGVASKER